MYGVGAFGQYAFGAQPPSTQIVSVVVGLAITLGSATTLDQVENALATFATTIGESSAPVAKENAQPSLAALAGASETSKGTNKSSELLAAIAALSETAGAAGERSDMLGATAGVSESIAGVTDNRVDTLGAVAADAAALTAVEKNSETFGANAGVSETASTANKRNVAIGTAPGVASAPIQVEYVARVPITFRTAPGAFGEFAFGEGRRSGFLYTGVSFGIAAGQGAALKANALAAANAPATVSAEIATPAAQQAADETLAISVAVTAVTPIRDQLVGIDLGASSGLSSVELALNALRSTLTAIAGLPSTLAGLAHGTSSFGLTGDVAGRSTSQEPAAAELGISAGAIEGEKETEAAPAAEAFLGARFRALRARPCDATQLWIYRLGIQRWGHGRRDCS